MVLFVGRATLSFDLSSPIPLEIKLIDPTVTFPNDITGNGCYCKQCRQKCATNGATGCSPPGKSQTSTDQSPFFGSGKSKFINRLLEVQYSKKILIFTILVETCAYYSPGPSCFTAVGCNLDVVSMNSVFT